MEASALEVERHEEQGFEGKELGSGEGRAGTARDGSAIFRGPTAGSPLDDEECAVDSVDPEVILMQNEAEGVSSQAR